MIYIDSFFAHTLRFRYPRALLRLYLLPYRIGITVVFHGPRLHHRRQSMFSAIFRNAKNSALPQCA